MYFITIYILFSGKPHKRASNGDKPPPKKRRTGLPPHMADSILTDQRTLIEQNSQLVNVANRLATSLESIASSMAIMAEGFAAFLQRMD